MKKFSILIFLLVIAFGVLVVQTLPQDTLFLPKKAETASKRGAQWLRTYPDEYKDPGIVWIIKKINDNYCHSSEITEFTRARFTEFESDPLQKYYKVLLDENTDQEVDYSLLEGREKYFDDIILPTLYCPRKPLPESTIAKIFASKNSAGYELTHGFLAMQFIRENNCITSPTLLERMEYLAKQIVKEQSQSSFSDLFAERVAFLQNSNYNHLVKDAWIQTIVSNQLPSGAWKDPNYFEKVDNPHTTVLAVWALSNYTKTCPF